MFGPFNSKLDQKKNTKRKRREMRTARVIDPKSLLRAMMYPRCLDALDANPETVYEIVTETPYTLRVLSGFYRGNVLAFHFHLSALAIIKLDQKKNTQNERLEMKEWQLIKQEAGRKALRHDLKQAKRALYKIPFSDALKDYIRGLEHTLATGGTVTAKGHYWQVRHAVEAGKPVPDNVLEDYPELKDIARTIKNGGLI